MARLPRTCWLLVCLALSVSSLGAQSVSSPSAPAPPTRDSQSLSVLKSTLAAFGGTLPADSTATGSVTVVAGSQEEQGTVRILTRGSSQSLEDVVLPNSDQTTVYCNFMAAQSDGTSQQPLNGGVAITAQTAFFPLPLLVGAENNPDISFQYVALESVNGAPAHHLRMWNTFTSRPFSQALSKYSVRDIWIDAASSLPVKFTYTQQAGNTVAQILVEVDLSNYQSVSGIAYPHQITKSLNGTPWLTISIQNVAFNTGLTDSNFSINCNQEGN